MDMLSTRKMKTTTALTLLAALNAPVLGSPPALCDPSFSSQTVSIVHVTDLHENYHPGKDGVSPYARIRGYFKKTRAENPYSLLINGGDDHEKGSVAGTLSRGAATREATRVMKFDIRVLGNHDFAWGEHAVLEHSRDPSGPVLASNLFRMHASTQSGPVDYVSMNVGCLRLGFLGLVGRPWNEKDEPYDGDYPGFRVDHDYAAVARRLAKKHAKDVDLLILVSHLGREGDLRLAAEVPEIRIVLGGHTHGLTWQPIRSGRALVVESGYDAEKLTRLDLTFDLASRRLGAVSHGVLRVGSELPVDEGAQSQILDILKRHAPEALSPVGCACAEATKSSAAAAAARAARAAVGADAALIDKKTVWFPWKSGLVTQQDFADAFKIEREPPGGPGFSSLFLVEVSSTDLARLAAGEGGARWSYAGPDKPFLKPSFRLALTRRAALHPESFFPGTTFKQLKDGPEVWEVLSEWAGKRRLKGLCIDEGCHWPGPTPN